MLRTPYLDFGAFFLDAASVSTTSPITSPLKIHTFTDNAVGSAGFCRCVINICTQGMQRYTTFTIPLTTSDFGTTQATTHLDFDTFGPLTHGVLNSPLHGATKHHTTLKLLSNALCDQNSIQIRLADFFNIDVYWYAHTLADISAQLVNILTLLTNHDAWTGSVNSNTSSVGRTLDINKAN